MAMSYKPLSRSGSPPVFLSLMKGGSDQEYDPYKPSVTSEGRHPEQNEEQARRADSASRLALGPCNRGRVACRHRRYHGQPLLFFLAGWKTFRSLFSILDHRKERFRQGGASGPWTIDEL